MNTEFLQRLVGVHNTLFNLSVTGDSIVPLAQVILTLNSMIGDLAEDMKRRDATAENANDNQPTNENMEEVPV